MVSWNGKEAFIEITSGVHGNDVVRLVRYSRPAAYARFYGLVDRRYLTLRNRRIGQNAVKKNKDRKIN